MIATDDTTAMLESLRANHRLLEKSISKVMESTLQVTDLIDPRDAYVDPQTGEIWAPVGVYGKGRDASAQTVYMNETELWNVQNLGCWFYDENEFALNVHENRISYVVGWGHNYECVAMPKRTVSDETLQAVKDVIDRFLTVNRWSPSYVRPQFGQDEPLMPGRASWGYRQPENLLRRDKLGECIIRTFRGSDTLLLRYAESHALCAPEGNEEIAPFGIECDKEDHETVLAYWIDGERVPAAEIQHRTRSGSPMHPRGIPINYACRKNLLRAQKILRNGSTITEIQTAIAMIRRHATATQQTIVALNTGNATQAVADSNGNTRYRRRYEPGTILDANLNTEYDFPSMGVDPGRYIASLQGELRAIAARHCMPEFMVSSDASNSAYASTMVAEGPAVKMFQRLQWDEIAHDLELIWQAVAYAVEAGVLPDSVLTDVDILAEAPQVQTRDKLKEAQTAQVLDAMHVQSPQTTAQQFDLDYEQEIAQIEDHAKTMEKLNPLLMPIPAMPGEDEPDDEPEPKEPDDE